MGGGMEKRRVLVVEDDVRSADGLRILLEMQQYEVRLAHDADEGLKAARAFAPHVVLCDIGLPRIDGYQFARALRADPEFLRVTLIAITGYVSPEAAAHAASAGFDAHISKPVVVRDLYATMAKLLPA
jgi:CheY-like chemotaxis protein